MCVAEVEDDERISGRVFWKDGCMRSFPPHGHAEHADKLGVFLMSIYFHLLESKSERQRETPPSASTATPCSG